jgi:hypothetical protein
MRTLLDTWKNLVASPQPTFTTPSFTPTGTVANAAVVASTVDAYGNVVGLTQNADGSLTPSISTASPVLTNVATNLGLVQPAAAPSISNETIVICIAGGIALIGILALIFKH